MIPKQAICGFVVVLGIFPWVLAASSVTSTDQQIWASQELAKRSPSDYTAYDQLGLAYLQKTRETADVAYFGLAEKALSKSLELAPKDFRAADPLVHMALVSMGEHNFKAALMYSQKAIALGAGNLPAFALEGDAYTDLGEYDKAQSAYDALRAIGTVSTSSLSLDYLLDSRIAYLHFLTGDTPGSIVLMKTAIAAGLQTNVPKENLAWLYFELGERYWQAGDLNGAASSYESGVSIDPTHYRSLAGLAKVRAAQGRFKESANLYEQSIAVVPFPQYIAELGDVWERLGERQRAQDEFDLVEYIAGLGTLNRVLANRELALFYADHDIHPLQALQLARAELSLRKDIYTWDTLAWALFKNGQLQEARECSANALRLNTADSLLFFHAGMIRHALGQDSEAAEFLDRALKLNPHFHIRYAEVASETLVAIRSAKASN
jgi:tetratricopeptide (TPR) repeat protein